MKKYLLPILTTALCLNATSAFAQNKGKNLAKALDAAVSRQAVKQMPGKVITTRTGKYFYHPVFGYIPSPNASRIYPNMHFAAKETLPKDDTALIQRTPFFEHQIYKTVIGYKQAFEFGENIDLPTITQAGYLWRVAHPGKLLQDNPYLYNWAKLHLEQIEQELAYNQGLTYEAPSIAFLKRLLNPRITPTSYAQLYELTPVYPKHITLNNYGFPVKTADDDYARILDNYLMLSNPQEMGCYDNTFGPYTPFTLTQEEHAAADKLLALRQAGEKLSANPSVRDVLELAYNRLETHIVPYSQIAGKEFVSIYKAYPGYKNTQLYRTIKGMLKDQIPLESYHQGYYALENVDITHLIVLDAVMGGVDPQNLMEVRRALSAFEKLCAEVHPKDNESISHLFVLRQNLRIVFDDFIRFMEDTQINWSVGEDPLWQKAELSSYAWSLLEGRDLHNLVGRNWKRD